ncbi:MAG: SPASM domain-containing protein, partial [Vallitaleaceae bacterium]|nr:SPASM domain-containing protein [Vallitaleaceae bacterium]
LSEEWGQFFHKNNFLIGLSLDGTIHTHDAYRRTASGKETFKDIMNTAHMFEKNLVEFNILTVVNKKTANAVEKIYKFYKKNNFKYLQFIPCLDPYEDQGGQMSFSLTPDKYGQFLCELFDLWYADLMSGDGVSIRQFDNYLAMLKGYPPESCDMIGQCGIQHVIESDGSVYPCDFYVLDLYKLGNVYQDSLEDMQRKRGELRFVEESVITKEECKACPYYYLCRGGCKRHRMMAGSDGFQDNYFCSSYKMFFAYATERMIQISKAMR